MDGEVETDGVLRHLPRSVVGEGTPCPPDPVYLHRLRSHPSFTVLSVTKHFWDPLPRCPLPSAFETFPTLLHLSLVSLSPGVSSLSILGPSVDDRGGWETRGRGRCGSRSAVHTTASGIIFRDRMPCVPTESRRPSVAGGGGSSPVSVPSFRTPAVRGVVRWAVGGPGDTYRCRGFGRTGPVGRDTGRTKGPLVRRHLGPWAVAGRTLRWSSPRCCRGGAPRLARRPGGNTPMSPLGDSRPTEVEMVCDGSSWFTSWSVVGRPRPVTNRGKVSTPLTQVMYC